MKFITLQNPYSIYQINKYEYGKEFLNNFINERINTKEEYLLQPDFFNKDLNNVRSYCIFESNSNIVLLDFINNDELYKYLKKTSDKNIYLINISKEKGIFTSDTKEKQEEYDSELTDILYKMDEETYNLYLHEETLKSKFDI